MIQKVGASMNWAERVKSRDNYTCRKCGSQDDLEAHHLFSKTGFPHLAEEIHNGATLCERCHKLFHSRFGAGGVTTAYEYLYWLFEEDQHDLVSLLQIKKMSPMMKEILTHSVSDMKNKLRPEIIREYQQELVQIKSKVSTEIKNKQIEIYSNMTFQEFLKEDYTSVSIQLSKEQKRLAKAFMKEHQIDSLEELISLSLDYVLHHTGFKFIHKDQTKQARYQKTLESMENQESTLVENEIEVQQ